MKVHYLALYNAFVIICAHGFDLCPDGSYVLGRGLSPEDQKAATDAHNDFRQIVVDGKAPGQPRAKYMKTMVYDEILGEKCVPISNQCVMNHLPVTDDRWHCVGQNIYVAWHSQFTTEQNWTAAVASWFYECYDFKYPNTALNSNDVGHYTQLVWAETDTVGCDYISFIDPKKPWAPFCQLYTCNYGPCGNYNHLPPYETVDDTSESSSSSFTSECSSSENQQSSESDSSSTSETVSKSSYNYGRPGIASIVQNIMHGLIRH